MVPIVYVLGSFQVWLSHGYKVSQLTVLAPALSAIRYQRKTLTRDIFNNTYTGNPRPELDEAWSYLLERKVP